jgi:O-antigen ligase
MNENESTVRHDKGSEGRCKLKKISEYTKKFLLSDGFIYLTAAIVYGGWISGYWMIFMAALFVFIGLTLVLTDDSTPALAPLFMFTMLISHNRHQIQGMAWLLGFIVFPVIGLIVSTIKHKNNLSAISPKNWKGFTFSLVLLILPMSLGGMFRTGKNMLAVLAAAGLMMIITVFYLFFLLTAQKKDGRILKYMLHILFAAGILVCMQLITEYIRVYLSGGEAALIEYLKYKLHDIGWGGPNNIAPIIAMTLPASLYFSIRYPRRSAPYILWALVQYALILSTGSRGTILIVSAAMPILLIYTFMKSGKSLQSGLTMGLAVAAGITLAAVFRKEIYFVFSEVINRGISPNGRLQLYAEAIRTFFRFPIFGAGWDYKLGQGTSDSYTPYWFHSTPLQILAFMGIIGAIFYGYFYYWRYRTFLAKPSPAVLAVFAGALLFDLYGMIDVNFFGPTFFIMMTMMTFAAESTLEDMQCRPLLIRKWAMHEKRGLPAENNHSDNK